MSLPELRLVTDDISHTELVVIRHPMATRLVIYGEPMGDMGTGVAVYATLREDQVDALVKALTKQRQVGLL